LAGGVAFMSIPGTLERRVHKRTVSALPECHDHAIHMLFTVLLVIVVGITIASAVQMRGRAKAADLGSMSEQWLAEHRAAHQD
jgi:hypothetical protein